MTRAETITEFYQKKFDWIPDNLRNELGHFNVIKLDPFVGKNAQPVPYKRRDYYKIMLVIGNSQVHYADKTEVVHQQALSFSHPQIPYQWEHLDAIRSGVFCIFDRPFFHGHGNLDQYAMFKPGGRHLFELDDEKLNQVNSIFQRMFAEISSEYEHKYDVLRTLVLELIHFSLKMDPAKVIEKKNKNAAERISALFMELLERQFPLDDSHRAVEFRSAVDFALQLNVHVNHLNRVVKQLSGNTTSQLIAKRLLQEAKIMLRHSTWTVAEIAFALGFTEATHFNNFFKKHTGLPPLKFRMG